MPFIKILLTDQKGCLKDRRICLEGKMSCINFEAVKGRKVSCPDAEKVPNKHRVLQTDAAALQLMELKLTVVKKIKEIVIREGIWPRRQQRIVSTRKGKKVMLREKRTRTERDQHTDSDEKSSKVEPL